jgi:hypothetical protein
MDKPHQRHLYRGWYVYQRTDGRVAAVSALYINVMDDDVIAPLMRIGRIRL